MINPLITAHQRARGTGIGNTNTFSLGLVIASASPKAKIAPEAPIATEKSDAPNLAGYSSATGDGARPNTWYLLACGLDVPQTSSV